LERSSEMPAANQTGFDATPFVKELGRVFGEYRQYNRRSTAILLQQLGAKLSTDLYMEAAKLRPSQQAKIEAVPGQTHYHVKRRLVKGVGSESTALATFKKGKRKGQFKSQSLASQIRRAAGGATHVTIEQEIRLRKRFAAVYQASGWLSPMVKGIRNAFRMNPPAVVVQNLSGTNLKVQITNPRPNSLEFAANYLEAAFAYRIREMRDYIERKLNSDVAEFNRDRPNFAGKDAASEVERALGGRAA
jgi:hypothetical protein